MSHSVRLIALLTYRSQMAKSLSPWLIEVACLIFLNSKHFLTVCAIKNRQKRSKMFEARGQTLKTFTETVNDSRHCNLSRSSTEKSEQEIWNFLQSVKKSLMNFDASARKENGTFCAIFRAISQTALLRTSIELEIYLRITFPTIAVVKAVALGYCTDDYFVWVHQFEVPTFEKVLTILATVCHFL